MELVQHAVSIFEQRSTGSLTCRECCAAEDELFETLLPVLGKEGATAVLTALEEQAFQGSSVSHPGRNWSWRKE